MIQTKTTLESMNSKKVLLLGNGPKILLEGQSNWESKFKIELINRASVSQYRAELLNIQTLDDVPYAVIADYSMVCQDDFIYVKAFRQHPLLADVPFITISEKGSTTNPSEALKAGIDDIYTKPVNWNEVNERLVFLNQFKPQMSQDVHKPEALYSKISPVKRTIDVVGALFGITLLSPLLVVVAIGIRLESKGPIIYRSKRAGSGYHVFNFLKFRSMYPDADQRLAQLQHLNQYNNTGDGPKFVKFANDPRVTKVGRLIRKTSIDELPQLFNVLFGDMSIIGNRPLPLYEAEQMTTDDWSKRFLAPAGLTGLWQVTKRGKSDMSVEERIALDVEYAQKHSLMMDIKIMVKTIPAMIQKENV
jgi:lipopolysaccharide/colanic/teichoic acid biosynthesis glycosyltransferase